MGNISEKAIKNIVITLYLIAMLAMGVVAIIALTPSIFGLEIEPLMKLFIVSFGLNIILGSFLISALMKLKMIERKMEKTKGEES